MSLARSPLIAHPLRVPEDEPFDPEEPIVVEITDSIDLHHFHPSEILDVVDAYLEAALEAGLVEVRLIHGRGKGVQRARVRRLLSEDPRVDRFEEAPPGHGGWGATVAWLKDPEGSASASTPRD